MPNRYACDRLITTTSGAARESGTTGWFHGIDVLERAHPARELPKYHRIAVKTFGQRRRSCPGIKIMHYDRGIAVAILAKTDCLDARHMTEPESARFLFGVGQIVGRVAHTTSQSLGVETR